MQVLMYMLSMVSGPPPVVAPGYPPPRLPVPGHRLSGPPPPSKTVPPALANLPKPLSEEEFLREKQRLIKEEKKYAVKSNFLL